jgi:imidazolonepropionase-like amidohydrolase
MDAAVLVEHANRLDLETGEFHPDSWVRVEGERIVDIGDAEPGGVADDVVRIDAGGRTLMPGLIDAHVHVTITTMQLAAMSHRPASLVANEARRIMERMVRRGFTTVRDAAGADHGLRRAVDAGLIRGPRLFYSGRALSQTGGHGDFRPLDDAPHLCGCEIHSIGFSHVVDGPDNVRKAAREELRRGAGQIKIMASGGVASPSDPVWVLQFSEEEMRAAVEEAAAWRTYVLAHAYTPDAISRAVRAGVRSIEHGNLIDDATAALMAERAAILVPTLVTYYKIVEMGRDLGFPEVSLRKVDDVLDAGLGSLEIAQRHGVPIGFGTDLLGETHEYQSDEFEIRSRVQPPIDILRSVTLVNAQLLERVGELGVIAPGAFADLLLLDGDPLRDLSVLAGQGERIPLVMRGGEVLVNDVH